MNKRNYVIALIIIIVDQLTKLLVINKNIEIIPIFLNITYTRNTGAAFGIGTLNIITIIIYMYQIAQSFLIWPECRKCPKKTVLFTKQQNSEQGI